MREKDDLKLAVHQSSNSSQCTQCLSPLTEAPAFAVLPKDAQSMLRVIWQPVYDLDNLAHDCECSSCFTDIAASVLIITAPLVNHRIGRPQEDGSDSYINPSVQKSAQGLVQTHESGLWSCGMACSQCETLPGHCPEAE